MGASLGLRFRRTACGAARCRLGVWERADCTVRATAACLGISYQLAHEMLARLGRKRGCRFQLARVAHRLGLVKVWAGYAMVKEVVPYLAKGRAIVCVTGHVFAVVDGTILDAKPVGQRVRVFRIYKVKEGTNNDTATKEETKP